MSKTGEKHLEILGEEELFFVGFGFRLMDE